MRERNKRTVDYLDQEREELLAEVDLSNPKLPWLLKELGIGSVREFQCLSLDRLRSIVTSHFISPTGSMVFRGSDPGKTVAQIQTEATIKAREEEIEYQEKEMREMRKSWVQESGFVQGELEIDDDWGALSLENYCEREYSE